MNGSESSRYWTRHATEAMADEPRPDSGWESEGEPASPEERCAEAESPELSAPSAAWQLLWESAGASAFKIKVALAVMLLVQRNH